MPEAGGNVLEVHGVGRRNKLNVRSDDAFDGINYQAAFYTTADAWTVGRSPVVGFQATFRGRTLSDALLLDPTRVRQVGLVIADQQVGPSP